MEALYFFYFTKKLINCLFNHFQLSSVYKAFIILNYWTLSGNYILYTFYLLLISISNGSLYAKFRYWIGESWGWWIPSNPIILFFDFPFISELIYWIHYSLSSCSTQKYRNSTISYELLQQLYILYASTLSTAHRNSGILRILRRSTLPLIISNIHEYKMLVTLCVIDNFLKDRDITFWWLSHLNYTK